MNRILIAVDGSKQSQKVIKALIAQVGLYKTVPELHLIYVHPPVPAVHGLFKAVGTSKQLARYYREVGEEALLQPAKMLNRAGLPFESRVLVGPTAETLVAEAKKLKCDMIFMGTHGTGAISGILLGSIASRTVHLAECPVTLIRN